MALVLTVREGDDIYIGDDIVIRAAEFKGRQVRLAIDAPPNVKIDRKLARHRMRTKEDPRDR